MKHFRTLQIWQIWTKGWGLRDWLSYVKHEGFPLFIAWNLPKSIALLTFVRVYANGMDSPSSEYKIICNKWGEK